MKRCAKVVGLRYLLTTYIAITCTLLVLMCSPPVCAQQNPPAQPTPKPPAPDETPEPPPPLFPPREIFWWWVSGQLNIFFQGHPPFHALYTGPNSLRPEGQAVTSNVVTLYTGYRFNKTTEV